MWTIFLKLFEFLGSPTGILLTLTSVLTSVLLFFIHKWIIRKDPRVQKMLEKFNGPKPYPIIGNSPELIIPNHKIIKLNVDMMDKYGRVIKGWLFNQPYVFIAEANVIEKLLSSNIHIDKSSDYSFLESWLGTGLLTSKGKKWHGRRKLLTPTFHFKILEDFLHIFNEQASVLVQILEGRAQSNDIFDICPYVARCTLDIICETAMGEKLNAQRNSDSEYVKAVYELGEMMIRRVIIPWLRVESIWNLLYGAKERKLLKTVHDFTEKVIQNRKAELEISRKAQTTQLVTSMTEKRRLAFLDLLLEAADAGNFLTDLDVREETDTFMFEGQDTTAASLSWTIFLLALNQDCQDKVRQELVDIFGDDQDRPITSEDLSKMKYLHLCIKESLRLYPSVPYFARQLFSDLDLGDDMVLPGGSKVYVTAYTLHRDPKFFPEPEKFCPERFEPQNCVGRNPYAYVPFSAGPRNCIGQKFALMEEKVVLSKIFMNYNVQAAEKLEDVQIVPDVILRPKNGLHVRFTKI